MEENVKTLEASSITFHIKEPKGKAATKTVFYFSLSAHDSLNLPPFCHPVDTLLKEGCRVISCTLPCHENNERPYNIVELWNQNLEVLTTFLGNLTIGVKEIAKHYPPPFGAAGISRGAFTSLCLASMCDEVETIVGFAPLLKVNEDLNMLQRVKELSKKKIHFFVGHDDTLIGTDNVIKLQKDLIEANKTGHFYTKISPSIGRGGHGTTDTIFNEGSLWLAENL